MREVDTVFINELLQPDLDLAGELAAYKAGVACDLAVALGGRFLQSSDGGYSVETIDEPVGNLSPAPALEPPTREIDVRFASIPFNPEIVTFVSLGRDEEGKPKPGIPILEHHKLESVARAKYGEDMASALGSSAGIIIMGILDSNKDKHGARLVEEYMINYHMIRADKLEAIVPILKKWVTKETEENEGKDLYSYREETIRRCEALVDVLSICSDRLMIKNNWLERRSQI